MTVTISQPSGHYLAELNVSTAIADLDSAEMEVFVKALGKVNALADAADGFVWRLQDGGDAMPDERFSDNPRTITTLSVWQTPDAFENYIWNTAHRGFMPRGLRWFLPATAPSFVMWWVPAGHIPRMAEARARLAQLTEQGPSSDAFDWSVLPGTRPWQAAGGPPRKP